MSTPCRVGLWAPFSDAEYSAAIAGVDGAELVRLPDIAALAHEAARLDVLVTPAGAIFYTQEVAQILHQKATRLRWIQVTSAGHDGMAQFGVPRGVLLSGNGGAFSVPVAEHAMALLLGLTRGLVPALDPQASPRWNRARFAGAVGLEGGTLAIVGLGGIGCEVASRARAFGMTVLGVSRRGRANPVADEVYALSDLPQVVARADAVILALPLVSDTRHLFNADLLAQCKRGAFIVNVGRGELIETDALCAALDRGDLAGAALDVTAPEPLPDTHPLWRAGNVIITPHIAPLGSRRAIGMIAGTITQNLASFVAQRPLAHQFTLD